MVYNVAGQRLPESNCNYFFLNFHGCSWWSGLQCFFGLTGRDATSGIRGTVFILMYVLSYVGAANLLRHAEGATWLAIVSVRKTRIEENKD